MVFEQQKTRGKKKYVQNTYTFAKKTPGNLISMFIVFNLSVAKQKLV